ncbi:TBC1 domain family member 30-like [Chionomys nivalis]|uniref:TBC1 domain family member 30-like n=1 Tax=Chionomys nivalis TaxID=269649 RepID=UPI00259162C9|nr:TBC1 domain family member 30-like [Chionomys nivalis]
MAAALRGDRERQTDTESSQAGRVRPCRALCSQRGRALPELAAGAAVRAMEVLPAGGMQESLLQAEATAGHSAAEGDEEPQPYGRTSRTASLVSGLLIELYSCTEEDEVAAGGDRASRGHPPRSDSLDSSTETSGSDVFLGGRGVGDSRVLQELRERPSLRLQMQYLRQKDSSELKTILRELKYRIGIQSAKLLRQLKQKDRLLHKVQKNCDIVTACLQAVSQKRSASTGTELMSLKVVSLLP